MSSATLQALFVAVHNHTPFPARGLEVEGVVFLLMYINDGWLARREDRRRVPRHDGTAVRILETQPLTPERVAQAFPLIQTAFPAVSLEDWRDFATPLASAPCQADGGIVTVVSEQGYIVGLCCHRVARDLQHGAVFMADPFLILDLFDQEAVVRALADAVESLARERRCTAIHTSLPETGVKGADAWLVRILRARGHRVESLGMCKPLANSPWSARPLPSPGNAGRGSFG